MRRVRARHSRSSACAVAPARERPPPSIDRTEEHTLEHCPECGGPIWPPSEKRSRIIEDIPQIKPEPVEHIILRCYCSKCRKLVEPVIPDAKHLIKRLAKYRQGLLTFLDDPGLPFDNNLAEREIRPAVLMRKNSFHNMSQDGASTQAVLMTIYRTLKLRECDPIETIVSALRHYLTLNFTLPPLPSLNIPSDG